MKRYLLLFISLTILPLVALSQGTTSSAIEGVITDTQGEPLPGANIVATHQPTGSRYGTSSRADGRYTIKNLRVGGPYLVEVSFVGFNAQKKEVSDIELGETIELNFTLEEGALELGEISVTAEADPIFNADRTGARTNISSTAISETPSISRSLTDFTRLTPQVTSGYSFGGANDRYNNILVDGATLNDVFGLGEGTPGSQAGVSSPISIDAIQEFNVDIAPFDVVNNNFTGGQINAITKSGTNKYTGSAYFQTRNESLVGNYEYEENGETIESEDFPEFSEQYFGLNIGGPIIEDKLFFFVNAELRRETQPITTGIQGSGANTVIPFDASTFDQIKSIAQNQYGYNPGDYTSPLDVDQDNDKILAKIDWNINDDHKFTFRYNYVDATDEEGIGRGRFDYSFSNRQYNFNSTQNSYVAQLKSTFGNNVYNEFRAVYTRIRDSRDVVAQPFPEVEISLDSDPGNFDFRSIYMGIDRFSQANALGQDLVEITNNLTYLMGDHEFTFGTSNQIFTFDNLFVQDAFGSYVFRGLDDTRGDDRYDFEDGTPFQYRYSYLLPGGNPRAEFSGIQLGLYAQDKWSVNNFLKLTFGIRADMPLLPDEPTFNPTAQTAFGYSTSNVASGNILWSPRFGFNWDLSQGERTTQLRGGVGIFSGTPPFVWISNQYSNTGADYGRVDLSGSDLPAGFQFSPDPNDQPSPLDPNSQLTGINTTEINLISDDFKYPQALKVNVGLDQQLPYGILATFEGIYTKAINDVTFTNINISQQGESAYGRPFYGPTGLFTSGPVRNNSNFTNALLLENTNKGYQVSLTGELSKRFDNGLRARIAYTWNRAENVNNGTSSRAISNWQFNENKDINNPRLGTADFERRHRILADVSYTARYADRFSTTISLIYDGRSGTPFSWIYFGNANGDTQSFNDLIYVPNDESEVVLVDGNWNEFNDWISSTESVNKYRGQVIPRNTAREPWTNFIDLRINQKIETFSGQSVELTASMFNVANFINSEWGIRKGVSFNNYTAVTFLDYTADGRPVIDFDPDNVTEEEIFSRSDLGSRWQMQFGLRYNF